MPEARDHQSIAAADLENRSRDLKLAIRGAIKRQARAWGIRYDQAEALLCDRRKVA